MLATYPMHAREAMTKKATDPRTDLLLLYGSLCLPHFLPTISAKPAPLTSNKLRLEEIVTAFHWGDQLEHHVPSPAHKVATAHAPTGEFRQKKRVATVIVIA